MGYKLNKRTERRIEELLGIEAVQTINVELLKAKEENPLTVKIDAYLGYHDKTRCIGAVEMRFSVLTELDKVEELTYNKWYLSDNTIIDRDIRGHIILLQTKDAKLTACLVREVTNGIIIVDNDKNEHNIKAYDSFMVLE